MVKVKCSYCEEYMDCPKSMLSAETHVCHICSNFPLENLSKEEIKRIAKEERMYERYEEDIIKMADIIFNLHSANSIMSMNEIKKISKEDVAQEHYFSGIYDTINFLIRSLIPPYVIKECVRSLEMMQTDMSMDILDEWHKFFKKELEKRNPKTDEEIANTLEEIRELWNNTPRKDLGGKTPREVYYENSEKVSKNDDSTS